MPSMIEKIAVLNPMPSARMSTAIMMNRGDFRKTRRATFNIMDLLPRSECLLSIQSDGKMVMYYMTLCSVLLLEKR
jgi:hypothetical protein